MNRVEPISGVFTSNSDSLDCQITSIVLTLINESNTRTCLSSDHFCSSRWSEFLRFYFIFLTETSCRHAHSTPSIWRFHWRSAVVHEILSAFQNFRVGRPHLFNYFYDPPPPPPPSCRNVYTMYFTFSCLFYFGRRRKTRTFGSLVSWRVDTFWAFEADGIIFGLVFFSGKIRLYKTKGPCWLIKRWNICNLKIPTKFHRYRRPWTNCNWIFSVFRYRYRFGFDSHAS